MFSNGDVIALSAQGSGPGLLVPAALQQNGVYFVRDLNPTGQVSGTWTFNLAATRGGPAIPITDSSTNYSLNVVAHLIPANPSIEDFGGPTYFCHLANTVNWIHAIAASPYGHNLFAEVHLMRWLLAAVLLAFAAQAQAQTTTFNAGDCSPYVAISNGGLTVTATLNPNNSNAVTCQANVGKYSGKWYFPRDPEHGRLEHRDRARQSRLLGTANPTASNIGTQHQHASATCWPRPAATSTRSYLVRTAQRLSASFTYTPGKTIGVAVDMDSNPRQIWVTPDITDTSGCGGGPVWNGDTTTWGAPVAAAPSTAHYPCGGPGTGRAPMGRATPARPGCSSFWTGLIRRSRCRITACRPRRRRSTLPTAPRSTAVIPGYLPWNAVGGASKRSRAANSRRRATSPTRQRGSRTRPIRAFPNDDRVLAGPAYNPATGIFTNGLPLYLWAVASGGGGTSGNNSTYAGHFGTAPCPSPANIGGTVAPGGYSGSGTAAWNAATHVTEGTVTWVCLTSVDYNTFTGANIDDVVNWTPSTGYFRWQFVLTSNGNVYYASTSSFGFTSTELTCTTGATEPTSTTAGLPGTIDGNCVWLYQGNVGYSSKAKILPHEFASYFWNPRAIAMVPQYNYHDTLRLWWGGNAKRLYQNGAAGEATQIAVQQRYNQPSDNGYIITTPGASGLPSGAHTGGFDLTQEITAAPGDGFADNMNPANDPLRFDPTKGTSIFTNVTYTPDTSDNPGTTGYGLCLSDFAQWVYRLQFQSTLGAGLFAGGFCTGGYNDNVDWFHHNIINSGGGPSGSGYITGSAFSNNLIIFRSSGTYAAPGPPPLAAGTYGHYGNASFNNTIVGPGAGACALCMAVQADRFSQYGPTLPIGSNSPLFNNLIFGWGQEWGTYAGQSDYGNCPGADCRAGNNGTDLPSSYTGTSFTMPPGFSTGITTISTKPFPGGDSMSCGAGNNQTCTSLNANTVFVHPNIGAAYSTSEDWRLCTIALCGHASPAIGAGTNFAVPSVFGILAPGNDILGQLRAGRVDLGAVQAQGSRGAGRGR